MGQVSYLSLSAFHIVTFAFKVKWVSLLNLQGVDDQEADLHGVKEEEHDEEGDRGAQGEAHRLHAVQGGHAVLSPKKRNQFNGQSKVHLYILKHDITKYSNMLSSTIIYYYTQ